MADKYGPWIGWNGGECPVEPNAIVHPCYYSGVAAYPGPASEMRWSHDELGGDIIAYRVKREPVVETVPVQLTPRSYTIPGFSRAGTVQTRDGTPDMTTLRWEDA